MNSARALLFLVVVAYPVVVYFGLDFFGTRTVALVIIGMALLRLGLARTIVGRHGRPGHLVSQTTLLTGALLVVGGWVTFSQSAQLLLYYPFFVNAVLLVFFARSLLYPPSLVELIARLQTADLPPEGVRYTRRVTQIWCCFFVVNGGLALATAWSADLKLWAIYNSAVSYGLMGLLFSGEYIVRRHVQRSVTGRASPRGWT
jgi:uncharacterized membrane protein